MLQKSMRDDNAFCDRIGVNYDFEQLRIAAYSCSKTSLTSCDDNRVPLCADGDIADRAAHGGFNEIDIVPGSFGQIFKTAAGTDITVKTGQILIDRFRCLQIIDHRGKVLNVLASHIVGNADRDPLHIGQHIQLRQRKSGASLILVP